MKDKQTYFLQTILFTQLNLGRRKMEERTRGGLGGGEEEEEKEMGMRKRRRNWGGGGGRRERGEGNGEGGGEGVVAGRMEGGEGILVVAVKVLFPGY